MATSDTDASPTNESERSASRLIVRVLGIWSVIAIAVMGLAWATIMTAEVAGPSMEPTLVDGDTIIGNKLASPEVGDVVTARVSSGTAGGRPVVKRVIGEPGDLLEYVDCDLTRNGVSIDEPYVHPSSLTGLCGEGFGPLRVPDGHVWLMGDNRAVSSDSRSYGSVDADDIDSVLWFTL